MSRKIHILSFLIALFLSCSILAACKKSECIGNAYSFRMNASFSPSDSVLHIGDTLFFSLIHSTTFLNEGTLDSIDFSGSNNMSSTLRFLELKAGEPDIPHPAVQKFEVINIQGEAYTAPQINPLVVKQLNFTNSGGFYTLKIGLKCLNAGTYMLSTDDIQNANRTSANSCSDKANILVEISNADKHLQYYQQNRPGYQISDYEKRHTYCFRVQ